MPVQVPVVGSTFIQEEGEGFGNFQRSVDSINGKGFSTAAGKLVLNSHTISS